MPRIFFPFFNAFMKERPLQFYLCTLIKLWKMNLEQIWKKKSLGHGGARTHDHQANPPPNTFVPNQFFRPPPRPFSHASLSREYLKIYIQIILLLHTILLKRHNKDTVDIRWLSSIMSSTVSWPARAQLHFEVSRLPSLFAHSLLCCYGDSKLRKIEM